LWVVGYGLNDLFPAHGQAIWAAIVPVGLAAGFMAVRGGGHEAGFQVGWRYGAVALTIAAFFFAAFFVLWPVSPKQIAALIPLFVAAAYVVAGIWWGGRYVATGMIVAALTLIGFVMVRDHFYLWMAGVGGTALILAGLWLRRV
jgi:hypothetical protein